LEQLFKFELKLDRWKRPVLTVKHYSCK
jgi:hypothetical protein